MLRGSGGRVLLLRGAWGREGRVRKLSGSSTILRTEFEVEEMLCEGGEEGEGRSSGTLMPMSPSSSKEEKVSVIDPMPIIFDDGKVGLNQLVEG